MAIKLDECPECYAGVKIKKILNDKNDATYYIECPCCGHRTGMYSNATAAIKAYSLLTQSMIKYQETIKKDKKIQEIVNNLKQYQPKEVDINKELSQTTEANKQVEIKKKVKVPIIEAPVPVKQKRIRRTKEELLQDPEYRAKHGLDSKGANIPTKQVVTQENAKRKRKTRKVS